MCRIRMLLLRFVGKCEGGMGERIWRWGRDVGMYQDERGRAGKLYAKLRFDTTADMSVHISVFGGGDGFLF